MSKYAVELGAIQHVYYVDDLDEDWAYTVTISEDCNIGFELITINDDEGEGIEPSSELGQKLLEVVRETEKKN